MNPGAPRGVKASPSDRLRVGARWWSKIANPRDELSTKALGDEGGKGLPREGVSEAGNRLGHVLYRLGDSVCIGRRLGPRKELGDKFLPRPGRP